MSIDKLTKPTDVSDTNLTLVIQNIHDKLNEMIKAVNSNTAHAVPATTETNTIKIIDDHSDGVVKLGLRVNNTWYTIDSTEAS